jgi:hypothetical protein
MFIIWDTDLTKPLTDGHGHFKVYETKKSAMNRIHYLGLRSYYTTDNGEIKRHSSSRYQVKAISHLGFSDGGFY